MKYALLQAPGEEFYLGQIVIVNTSTHTGKKEAEKLCLDGYTPCGWIDSDLSVTNLEFGFRSNVDKKIDSLRQAIRNANEILNR